MKNKGLLRKLNKDAKRIKRRGKGHRNMQVKDVLTKLYKDPAYQVNQN